MIIQTSGVKMKRGSLVLAIALAAISSGCANQQRSRDTSNPNISAETLALQVCSNCHGVDGNSVSPNFPNLAGQPEAYFIAQLTGFKSHNRSDPAGFEYMWGLSKHLTDDQIKGLAAYFARQKPKPNAIGDARLVSAGKQIFENGLAARNIPACSSCHGTKGQGNDRFPRLADQHADYLVKQLQVFQRTDERPEGSVMKEIAHSLTFENMQNVAAFLEAAPTQ